MPTITTTLKEKYHHHHYTFRFCVVKSSVMIVQGRFLLLRNDIVLITVALLTCNIVNAAEELEYVDYSDVDDYSNKSCICVPYYKCRAIREDGAGLISIRYVVQYLRYFQSFKQK